MRLLVHSAVATMLALPSSIVPALAATTARVDALRAVEQDIRVAN